MNARKLKYYEFFAGGGMARLGLGDRWECLFANDFSQRKAQSYRENFHPAPGEFDEGDVFDIALARLPRGADLAWASFPCQDLSLAGAGQGLNGARSGSFWGFWRLMQALADAGQPTPVIVLENVVGTISANQGKDFQVLLGELVRYGYCVGPLVLDAQHFIPQSRPRLFIVAVHKASVTIPSVLVQSYPDPLWHPKAMVRACQEMPAEIQHNWVWWNLPAPPPRTARLIDLLENEPTGVKWHTPQETNRLLELMTPLHRAKVQAAQATGQRVVGTIYRRIRTHDGVKAQRAEIRIDNVSGCLRTGSGGSSKQFLMIIEGKSIRSRLLSPREAARLMGVSDAYRLPENYSDAYHLMGDGLAVPVVAWLSEHILIPLLTGVRQNDSDYQTVQDGYQIRLLEKQQATEAYTTDETLNEQGIVGSVSKISASQ
jgi:DNA (cytosine-5)-methyltransferase 1